MDRKEFISMFGVGAAAALIGACAAGCSKAQTTKTAPNVDFRLDLTQPAYQGLNSNGSSVAVQGVVVARTTTGAFIAVSQACTHQGIAVLFRPSNTDFLCPAHGSSFGPTGAVGTGPATVSLKSYNTQLSGNVLHVWG